MATKSQRRKEKHKRKREKKKKQQQNRQGQAGSSPKGGGVGSNVRHRERISRQVPQAWPDELPEDRAVFEDSALETLSAELTDQAVAVREALEMACDSRREDAINRVSGIPRSSPFSEWRLFLRGLVSWLEEDKDAAGETWRRLDFDRRPGRIATAMMNALRTDLESASAKKLDKDSEDDALSEWPDRLDDQLLYHAKLLRRVRFDRAAIKIAESGALAREESTELFLGPRKIRWLKRFLSEYRETEPDLTTALKQVALNRAFAQSFSDLFAEAASAFEGPPHDRRNLLLSFFYYIRFSRDESAQEIADRSLKKYLEEDLPNNTELSEPLRAAIASEIHLQEANMEIRPPMPSMFSMMFAEAEDSKSIRKHLNASMKAYPANRSAYKTYVDWIETKLDNDRLTKAKRKPLLEEQAKVMKKWTEALPDDAKPRLWLVDYLLENEQTDEAKPHVDWLSGARHDDPRVRATPWKWHLLEAMRLCRRKAWLDQVPAHLEEAERLWPVWLSREWLPYLKAAVTLRAGNTEQFETERTQIAQDSGLTRDSLADACMMLGAAQHMRVPSAQLKPLRAPVDQAVKNLRKISDDELLSVSRFFWDLHRTKLVYPAYRMHGGKIVDEMSALIRENPNRVLENLDDEQIHAAILLCSEHRCLSDGYELKLPNWFSHRAVQEHPIFAAAQLNAVVKFRVPWRAKEYEPLGRQLREAAQSQRDPYYRYWFASLADELDDMIASDAAGPFGSGFNPFDIFFGDEDEDY